MICKQLPECLYTLDSNALGSIGPSLTLLIALVAITGIYVINCTVHVEGGTCYYWSLSGAQKALETLFGKRTRCIPKAIDALPLAVSFILEKVFFCDHCGNPPHFSRDKDEEVSDIQDLVISFSGLEEKGLSQYTFAKVWLNASSICI